MKQTLEQARRQKPSPALAQALFIAFDLQHVGSGTVYRATKRTGPNPARSFEFEGTAACGWLYNRELTRLGLGDASRAPGAIIYCAFEIES